VVGWIKNFEKGELGYTQMISKRWRTSERKYGVLVQRDISIPMSDGTILDCDLFHPDAHGKFPTILGVHGYPKSWQSAPAIPRGVYTGGYPNGQSQVGDPNFYVRRGYAQVIANVRGSGKSCGRHANYDSREVEDTYEIIEWIAAQPWSDGHVGMFGISYASITQQQVASLNPPSLKAIFAPYGYGDFYRDKYYHGGILSHVYLTSWAKNFRAVSWSREKLGDEKYDEAIVELLRNEDICVVPTLVKALQNPGVGENPFVVDILINAFDGPYYEERNVRYHTIKVPSYVGADWGCFGLHLPGAFHGWENIKSPKKMVIGPPIQPDRPLYQYQYESLRWFDYWLKGMDNGIMDEPPIRLFVMGADEWKTADEWPLPETKWTPFYLHKDGLLSEHEFWPNEGGSSYEDNPFVPRGKITFLSPPMVENTEVIGPIVLNLYGSTTDTEVLWFVSLLDVDPQGEERLLTKGWLRGSQREVDPERSKPWEPFHPHRRREPLTPNQVYEFGIRVIPTGNVFRVGHRIGLRISSADNMGEVKTTLEGRAQGHLWRQAPSWVTVYHNTEYPSHLLLPVTKGNIIGSYMSGGKIPYVPLRY